MIEQLRRQLQTAQDEIDNLTTRISHSIQTDNQSSMVSTDFEMNTNVSSGVERPSSVETTPSSSKKVECMPLPNDGTVTSPFGDNGFGDTFKA